MRPATSDSPPTSDSTALWSRNHESPVGPLTLVASDTGLVAVLWPNDPEGRVRFNDEIVDQPGHPILSAAAAQLDEYFAGDRQDFDLPLDMRGTAFQVEAWHALTTIPFGETASYAQQAARIGRPKAVRAIGSANGRNPLSIVVPCHRVVGANGSLSGFAGGLDAKRFLLNHESPQTQLL